MEKNSEENFGNLSRRRFMRLSLVASAVAAAYTRAPWKAVAAPVAASTGNAGVEVLLRINGTERRLTNLDPRVTLLDALRERLALTGSKKGCDQGQCGACTILVDGKRINSCLALAVCYHGAEITTVEGLAEGGGLHPLQAAFVKHDAFQCGYCTPGQLCSAAGLIKEGHAKTDAEIREQMSGNICRCGAYNGIAAAVREVQGMARKT
jgi:xanthine dehydrogenase YagT iron-sulfur-binding subunit